LFEVLSLFKPPKTREEGRESITIKGLERVSLVQYLNIPTVNVIKNALGLQGPTYQLQIILNPHDKVVLECALDNLM
jgi:hypothetical protein